MRSADERTSLTVSANSAYIITYLNISHMLASKSCAQRIYIRLSRFKIKYIMTGYCWYPGI